MRWGVMWYGMVHEMECGLVQCGMRCYTLHNMLCHITQPHTAHHCCTILWHSHITCRVMCNMWWCDGAWCGMWCNEQHARCGVVCHVLLRYGMVYDVEYGMVQDVAQCGVECGVSCAFVMWCVMCFMVHITHHALPHLTTTYCTPCYVTTYMCDVWCICGMWCNEQHHVQYVVVWCGDHSHIILQHSHINHVQYMVLWC